MVCAHYHFEDISPFPIAYVCNLVWRKIKCCYLKDVDGNFFKSLVVIFPVHRLWSDVLCLVEGDYPFHSEFLTLNLSAMF